MMKLIMRRAFSSERVVVPQVAKILHYNMQIKEYLLQDIDNMEEYLT